MTGPVSGLAIRQVGIAHAEVLAAVQAACFAEVWSPQFVASIIAQPGSIALLAADSAATPEDAVGMALVRAVAGEAELLAIGVLPEARGRGTGRALLEAALAGAARAGASVMFLEVAADNGPARALYRRAGFAQVGRRAGYYRAPSDNTAVDALVLSWNLPPQAVAQARPGDCFGGPKGTQWGQ